MDPLITSAAISAAGGAAQGLLGGQEEREMVSRFAIPSQLKSISAWLKMLNRGGGDMGFGPALQAGKASWQNMLGQTGLSPTSGMAQGGWQDILIQAMLKDAMGRRQFGTQLVNARPAEYKAHSFKGPVWEDAVQL